LMNWLPLQTNTAPFGFTVINTSSPAQQYFRAVFFP
jgi:hypothetical protein